MANARRKHGTGSASSVVTVADLGVPAADGNPRTATDVEVVSITGTEPIYFTTDGTAPTVRGDDTYVVQSGGALRAPARGTLPITLKMISAADFTYAAEVYAQ